MIQQAIDRTQSGAILLKRGVYRISGTIRINRSGIVLRGEGEGEDGTLLVAAGTTKRDLVVIGGSGSRRVESNTEAYDILDDYVPAGRFWVRSPRAGEFRVGDNVVVYRPSTREWISDLKMDQIPPRADGLPITQWEPGRFDTYAERVITLIKGDTLHFENPVVMSLDRKYGGGRVLRYSYADRIEECGVENLRFDSDYTGPEDENHGWNAVAVKVAAHCWVRNVTSLHFGMGLVTMDQYAKNISVPGQGLHLGGCPARLCHRIAQLRSQCLHLVPREASPCRHRTAPALEHRHALRLRHQRRRNLRTGPQQLRFGTGVGRRQQRAVELFGQYGHRAEPLGLGL